MLDVCENRRIKIPEIEEHEFVVKEIGKPDFIANSIKLKHT